MLWLLFWYLLYCFAPLQKKTKTKNNFWFLTTIKDSISLNFVNRRRFTNEAIGRTHSVQWPFMCDQPSCLHCEYDDGQPFKSQREDNNYIHPSHVPVSSLSVNTSFGCWREKKESVHSYQLWYSRPQYFHPRATVSSKRKICIKWENLDETVLTSHFSEDSKMHLLACGCEVGAMDTVCLS